MLLGFLGTCQNMPFLSLWHFFLPNGYPNNSVFEWQCLFIRFVFLMDHFLMDQNTYCHQTFQGGDMLRGALTHKYDLHLNGVVLLCHVTNKIHLHLQNMYWHHNWQGADLVLGAPKHDPFTKWPDYQKAF